MIQSTTRRVILLQQVPGVDTLPIICPRKWGQSLIDYQQSIYTRVAFMRCEVTGWSGGKSDDELCCHISAMPSQSPVTRSEQRSAKALQPPSAPQMPTQTEGHDDIGKIIFDNICGNLPPSLVRGMSRSAWQSETDFIREAHMKCFAAGFVVVGSKDAVLIPGVLYLIIEPIPDGMGG